MSSRSKMRAISPQRPRWEPIAAALFAALFFFVLCLSSTATVKETAILLLLLTLAAAFLCFSRLRERIAPPLIFLGLVTLLDGISTFYAVSGKFALYEFLKVLISFCLAVLLTAFPGGTGPQPGRYAAAVLSGCAALSGLVSIDLLSTRVISTPVLQLLAAFTPDYANLTAVESGIRMNSLFANPNVFAGCAGIGVLLALGLAVSAETAGARAAHTVCLFVSALSFILAFSMGATATIALAFLVFLCLEKGARRADLLLLMLETLLLVILAAALISATSLTTWERPRLLPLACTVLGSVLLCLSDRFPGRRAAQKLAKHGKAILLLLATLLAGLLAFLLLAWNLTGGVTLSAGESLRRAAYPAPGAYTLAVETTGNLTVLVESQNRQDTMMHTSSTLYNGPASQAAFTVPEDSMVVYFNFFAENTQDFAGAALKNDTNTLKIPLGYRLLPGFIANRLQGLFANQNAIQRLVFFSDGMKLFRRSPVAGLGMGAFENGIQSVQSFYYETKYAHNHYIQALIETGVAGLLLFLGLLGVSAAAVLLARRKPEVHPLTPALGAALVFMAGHAAVEVVFSSYPYLPLAFGVFALIGLCCKPAFPPVKAEKLAQIASVLIGSVLLGVFGAFLFCNMQAQAIAAQATELSQLKDAVALDRFEWADYMLSYIINTTGVEVDGATRAQADAYAARLEQVSSNTTPIYLAEYYFSNGNLEKGLEMTEKYVDYVSSNRDTWNQAFSLLERYETDEPAYWAGVARIIQKLEAWNTSQMGEIVLDGAQAAFVARAAGEMP